MSSDGHLQIPTSVGPTAMVIGGLPMAAGTQFVLHSHDAHQIAWAASGVLTVQVADAQWILPATRALWLPAQTGHRTGTSRGADVRAIYVDRRVNPRSWTTPVLVGVDPLLHLLFEHHAGLDHTAITSRRHCEAMIFDVMHPLATPTMTVHLPVAGHARRVADALLRDPADTRSLAELAHCFDVGERTLARDFVAGTGLSFGRWRTQLRMSAALPLLARDVPIDRVATRVGYATSSGFVAAFVREIGVTPGAYFA